MTVRKVANLAWQLNGDAALVRDLAEDADVLSLVECRKKDDTPVDVARILGRDWKVRQDCTNGARAGSAIAVRRDSPVQLRSSRLWLASPAGRGVQARYLRSATLVDHGQRRRVAVVHLPLLSTGRHDEGIDACHAFIRRARHAGQPWAVDADFNANLQRILDELDGAHVAGQGVVGSVWGKGWGQLEHTTQRRRATDHRVLTLETQEKR